MSREFRIGVFVFASLAAFTAAVFLIGRKQLLFTSTYRLRTSFQNVAGLNTGAEVRVGGMHQGTVSRIALPKRTADPVTVEVDVDRQTRAVLNKDSVAAIKTEGVLGSKYIEISFGSEHGAALKDGDTIGSEPPVDISDLIAKTREILDSTNGTMKDVAVFASSLKSTMTKIDEGQGTVGALVNDRKVFDAAAEATASAKAGAMAFEDNMEALKHNFFLRGFYKKRGYDDSADLSKYEIRSLPKQTPLRKFTYDGGKLFDKPDTAKLKNQKVLNDAGAFLEANPFSLAVVVASTSLKGDADKQRTLTKARAMVVREYLARGFRMDDTRLRTLGAGESKTTGDGGAIEIVVYPPDPPKKASGG